MVSCVRHETRSYTIENRRWDPVTGSISSVMGAGINMAKGAADIVVKPIQVYHQQSKMKSAEIDNAMRRSTGTNLQTPSQSLSLTPTHPNTFERRRSPGRGCGSTTGAAMKASASGLGTFFKSYGKSCLDVPLAITEGLRATPRLYGDKVKDHSPITDWKSGAMVGGQNFVVGIGEGFADLFYQPYKGGRDGGAAGAALGVGKGVLNMLTKSGSGKSFNHVKSRI